MTENTIAATLVILASIAGVILTILTLPGTWLAVLMGVIVAIWRPELISWWTVGAAGALAVIAEIVELAASAAGRKKRRGHPPGGPRRGHRVVRWSHRRRPLHIPHWIDCRGCGRGRPGRPDRRAGPPWPLLARLRQSRSGRRRRPPRRHRPENGSGRDHRPGALHRHVPLIGGTAPRPCMGTACTQVPGVSLRVCERRENPAFTRTRTLICQYAV